MPTLAAAASSFEGACGGRPRRTPRAQNTANEAPDAVSLEGETRGFLAGIFMGGGESLAIAGSEI